MIRVENPCQGPVSQAEAAPQQPAVGPSDCHNERRIAGISGFRAEWEKAFLSKLRDFLLTRSIEE
jgi:hypothetical protein